MPTIPTFTTGYTLEEAEQDIADLRGDVDGMNEVLSLLDGPIPNTTPISGCQLYSTNGQPGYVNFTALTMSMMGAQPATFPNTTVTAASLTTLSSFFLPAGDADIGAVYETETWGNGVGASIGNRQTLQLAVVFGGNTMSSVQFGTTALPDTAAIFRFHAVARVICHTTGLTGTWSSYISVSLSQFNVNYSIGNQNFDKAVSCESTGTTTVDTTTGETLALAAAWGATTGAPTITSQVMVPKRIC